MSDSIISIQKKKKKINPQRKLPRWSGSLQFSSYLSRMRNQSSLSRLSFFFLSLRVKNMPTRCACSTCFILKMEDRLQRDSDPITQYVHTCVALVPTNTTTCFYLILTDSFKISLLYFSNWISFIICDNAGVNAKCCH